ncbi:hypothetical protein H9X85_03135 [Anaerotignum lactatifermentans]|uniref:Uncharacterized protein n=1 Tax=Anaerotignum lactatifermentans TaxID=160404 RepID=A0ABS2GAJ1_9FIRM|nr:hypothetical protein [Anaerotignum lactatifermentans]MBM6828627.1 hypothetical protein [Anaerotignum lactatifermentans]MBM6878501.1 hypothetical protein [Anaerotignum lactatifermentans]MBM6950209.1 hypothetical protein [Anaerotignum lactatifermentans]
MDLFIRNIISHSARNKIFFLLAVGSRVAALLAYRGRNRRKPCFCSRPGYVVSPKGNLLFSGRNCIGMGKARK